MSCSESDDIQEIKVRGRPKVTKDSFIELEERFDQHKLNYIIKNKDTLRERTDSAIKKNCYDCDPFNIDQKYPAF